MYRVISRGILAVVLPSVLLLAGCASPAPSEASGGEITVALANHVWSEQVKQLVPQFESESGIKVNVTTYGEQQLSDLYNVKLNAGSSDLDVLMYRPPQEGRTFATNQWLEPLTERVQSDSGWDWSDFQPGYREAVTDNDIIYGVPVVTDRGIVYYRSDLLSAAGLEVPATLDEFAAAVKQLTDPSKGIYGIVGRGQRSAAVSVFSPFLYSMGGDWNDGSTATLNTPAALAAYKLYGGLLNQYGPPGTTNMGWPEAVAIFQQGKAAFMVDADSIYTNLTDPEKSSVADKVGFAVFPAGEAGRKTFSVASWALGINASSAKKDAAWKFIEWITNQANVLKVQSEGIPGARQSAWDSAEGVSGFPAQLAEVIRESGEIGVGYYIPRVLNVGEARDIVGYPVVVGIDGGDVEAAVNQSQADYQALLDKQK